MAWIHLTLVSGEKRLINMNEFVFVKPEGSGSYLIGIDQKNSLHVKESKLDIGVRLKAFATDKPVSC